MRDTPAEGERAARGTTLARHLLDGAPDARREAVATALNLLDDRRARARAEAGALLSALEARASAAPRIGVTGAPGVGKSTLLDALVRRARKRGERIGVLAVDPSSPRTGGALLGDRLRVRAGSRDEGVFFRSMAARARLGGLAEGARGALLVLAAAFDRVFVETVGVGQSEGEVAELVDTLLFVAQPDSGDLLQFMKAGVLELPDVFAVNKDDLPGAAERAARELQAGLGLGEAAHGWRRPVLRVSARAETGLDALEAALDAHHAWLCESGERTRRRRRGRDQFVRASLQRRYGEFGLEQWGGDAELERRLEADAEKTATHLCAELSQEIKTALTRSR